MQRLLIAVIIVLLGLLLDRDRHVERGDSIFRNWLLRNTEPGAERAKLTVVELGPNVPVERTASGAVASSSSTAVNAVGVASPIQLGRLLQSILSFEPPVIAIEPVLGWRERDKEQELVFLEQAMRVPKLLLGAELTSAPDPDVPPAEIPGFVHVRGRRGDLPTFTGIGRQPDEDLRLISTPGYTNLPEDADETRVPLLFNYRGEVIPAFALQAFLAWARIPMSEVDVEIGGRIGLPHSRGIPINPDGSLNVNPNSARAGQHFGLDRLLTLAQDNSGNSPLHDLHDHIVLVRAPEAFNVDDSEQARQARASDVFAAALATMQSSHFLRRVSVLFDYLVFPGIALLAWPATRIARVDLILLAIAMAAGYCLIAFGLVSDQAIWLPAIGPLTALWLVTIIGLSWPRQKHPAEAVEIVASPPVP